MAPITEVAIEDAVRQWVVDITGLEVIIASQTESGFRPANPYGTIQILTLVGTELKDVSYQDRMDDDVDETTTIRPVATIQVDFFGDGARDQLLKLKASVWQAPTIEYFQTNGLGFVNMSGINELDRLTDTEWEKRAQADFDFNIVGDYTVAIGTIDSVEIENDINNTIIEVP